MQRNTLPASAAAALVGEVSPTWLPHGPSRNSRALSKLHSLPPSTHRMCFFLIRQREHASFLRVLALEALGGALRGPRTAGSASRTANKVRCISSEGALNRMQLVRSQEIIIIMVIFH